jgi:hypothetical protein
MKFALGSATKGGFGERIALANDFDEAQNCRSAGRHGQNDPASTERDCQDNSRRVRGINGLSVHGRAFGSGPGSA